MPFSRCLFYLLVVTWSLSGSASSFPQEAESPAVGSEQLQEVSEGLASEDPATVFQTIRRLDVGQLQPDQRAGVIEQLIKALDHKEPDIRAAAARMLGEFGQEAEQAIPVLLRRAGDTQYTRKPEAVWVAMSDALAAMGPASLPPMLKTISDPEHDRTTYYAIAGAIAEQGEAARSSAPILIEHLRTGPENERWATMFALSKLGDAALPAIPDYIAQLDHENFNMQCMACRALAALGPASKEAVPKLLELMKKGNILSTRTHAAMCLGAIGPVQGVDSVGILMEMAQEKNAFSQERAMIALGRLGREAERSSELIERLIGQDDFSQKPEAARALWLVTGKTKRALEVLSELIDSPTYDFRVMKVLVEMGPLAKDTADLLAQKLADPDQGIRLAAVQALGAIGPAAAPHVDTLRTYLDSDRDVVAAIHEAIEKIESTRTD